MGLVYADITLKNAIDVANARSGMIKEQEIREIEVTSVVDTGAWTLVINETIREKLGLPITGVEPGNLADGTQKLYNLAGPLEIRWKNRRTICEALVVPTAKEVLFGAIPLEGMDLTINPKKQEVVGIHGEEVLLRI